MDKNNNHISEKFGNVNKDDQLRFLHEVEYDYSEAYIKKEGVKYFYKDNSELFFKLAKKRVIVGVKEIIIKEIECNK